MAVWCQRSMAALETRVGVKTGRSPADGPRSHSGPSPVARAPPPFVPLRTDPSGVMEGKHRSTRKGKHCEGINGSEGSGAEEMSADGNESWQEEQHWGLPAPGPPQQEWPSHTSGPGSTESWTHATRPSRAYRGVYTHTRAGLILMPPRHVRTKHLMQIHCLTYKHTTVLDVLQRVAQLHMSHLE